MTEKQDWDSWKQHDNYRERSIFMFQAEKDQFKLVPWDESIGDLMKDDNQILVRGVYVGSIPKTWTARLRLGDNRPMVFVTTDEGKHFSFVPDWTQKEKEL